MNNGEVSLLVEGEMPRHLDAMLGFEPSRYQKLDDNKTSRICRSLGSEWDFIVVDRRQTMWSDLVRLATHGIVIGLDEGGGSRRQFPFLIDTLPTLSRASPPNIYNPTLLELPRRAKGESQFPPKKILVSFGGEDPASLTTTFLKSVAVRDVLDGSSLTIVVGPAFTQDLGFLKQARAGMSIRILRAPKNLRTQLHRYDLLITSFGLTCFEALSAGVPVALFNPSTYHRQLGLRAGLPEIGMRRVSLGKLRAVLRNRERTFAPMERWRSELAVKKMTLDRLLTGLKRPVLKPLCPSCKKKANPVIARFPKRSYFHCGRCGLIYLLSFSDETEDYGPDYFDQEYRQNYGKTYLEDYSHIKDLAYTRISEIERILKSLVGKSLLDVGCALGPFLDAARERNMEPHGVDVSSTAVEYVRQALALPCEHLSFEEYPERIFDIITMWFVIEHLESISSLLQKVNRMLPRGGLFGFSTPNSLGISGRKNLVDFLKKSPVDHLTVWSPRVARRVLRDFGFKIMRIRITGHHPERFPEIWQRFLNPKRIAFLSRFLGWGDTFEIYAVKERDL
jgi:2-polyprenyl-3-methyl-5-hydroxy-6-metoxy-1,4-benzoquinol methylase